MEPIGATGVVTAIWHGCAPTKPGRTAEAWRQKRTQSCRLTRRASPSVRTWNVTARVMGARLNASAQTTFCYSVGAILKRLSDRSSRSIRTALPHTQYLKGRRSSVKQTCRDTSIRDIKFFFSRDEGVLNCFQPGRLAFKTSENLQSLQPIRQCPPQHTKLKHQCGQAMSSTTHNGPTNSHAAFV